MRLKIREFDEEAICDKCGHEEINWKYVSAQNRPFGVQEDGHLEYGRVPEHIGMCCDRCGYFWKMAVKGDEPLEYGE